MRTLGIYLWKEWRDHRAVAIGFAIAVPALLALAAFLLPAAAAKDRLFASIAGAGSLLIAILSIGADLVPGEARRERLDFLRRMPGGLGVSFAAKAIFFALALPAFALVGYLAGGAAGALLAGGEWLPRIDGMVLRFAPLLALVFWVLAVSCWLPRGALVLPAALLLLGLLGLPFFLVALWNPGLLPTGAERIVGAALAIGGSLLVAFVSFVRGYRFGGGPGSAAWRGLAVAFVLFLPAWAWAGYRAHDWRTFDPTDGRLVLDRPPAIGTGGRYAFLTARRQWGYPTRALIVDLADGSWRLAGGPDRGFGFAFDAPTPLVFLSTGEVGPSGVWMELYDGATGERVKAGWSDLLQGDLARLLPRGARRIELPDGRALRSGPIDGFSWRLDGAPRSEPFPGWPVGMGIRGTHDRVWDPIRGEIFTNVPKTLRLVRPGRWLLYAKEGWRFYDPATREEAPVPSLGRKDRLVDLQRDGRLLVFRAEKRLCLVEPESGREESVAIPGEVPSFVTSHDYGRSPQGARVLRLQYGDRSFRIARLGEGRLLLAAKGAWDSVTLVDEESAIAAVDAEGALYRIRFGSEEAAKLFPR